MPADCYRCRSFQRGPSDPFGACLECSAFACATCGNRVPRCERFYCLDCFNTIALLPSGGIPPLRDDGGGGGGGGGPRAPEPDADAWFEREWQPLFASSADFEVLAPRVAEESARHRSHFHQPGVLRALLDEIGGYAVDQQRRRAIDEQIGYVAYDDAAERAWRADALAGAKALSHHIGLAMRHGRLNLPLLADAFGLAAATIEVKPGEAPGPERLALLSDGRLRFVVGFALPATAAVATA